MAAAAELLDYNQVQEQSPSTGDVISDSGGLLTWQFRCDPNLSWDPSQSFFAMDITVSDTNNTPAVTNSYQPGAIDLRPFFPLRCFSSMTHIIDGVTVAHSNQPYADKLIQEKFLHETTVSNLTNFEAAQLTRYIDTGRQVDNIFKLQTAPFSMQSEGFTSFLVKYADAKLGRLGQKSGTDLIESASTHTVIFQPPFDFWTKHQRVSGGNHQVQMVLKPAQGLLKWGSYISTPCIKLEDRYSHLPGVAGANQPVLQRVNATGFAGGSSAYGGGSVNAQTELSLHAQIQRCRLMRRMVRFTVERPIVNQEFSLTEMAFYHGTPTGGASPSAAQNFLLPSSTFGLVFYWRDSTNSEFDVVNDYLNITNTDGTLGIANEQFQLDQFYFTYGGETYPSQRVEKIGLPSASGSGIPCGFEKLQLLTHQLQGVYNMPMENMNTNYSGEGLMARLDANMFFFPVAKHNNSDNSDLQVYWSATQSAAAPSRSLVVVALYDARVDLSYNAANQLEKVTKTEWK